MGRLVSRRWRSRSPEPPSVAPALGNSEAGIQEAGFRRSRGSPSTGPAGCLLGGVGREVALSRLHAEVPRVRTDETNLHFPPAAVPHRAGGDVAEAVLGANLRGDPVVGRLDLLQIGRAHV